MSSEIVKRIRSLFEYDPETGIVTRKIPVSNLKKGAIAGSNDGDGYLRVWVDRVKYRIHTIAWLHHYGSHPNGVIDHINGNGKDNRISNLRDCSFTQNLWNKRIAKNNTSGAKGVHWSKKESKWIARITANLKRERIGAFDDLDEARKAYEKRSKELHGKYSIVHRLPDEQHTEEHNKLEA